MKKTCNWYLFLAFGISYICFGAVVLSRTSFVELITRPLQLSSFALGCLGPFIATLISYAANREETGGLHGLRNSIAAIENPQSAYLILLFLALHYGLAVILGAVEITGGFVEFIKYLPVMLILFGSQEIGWRAIVQPRFEETKGFWKSRVITGLLWALWFLPLIYVPDFVVHPNFFIQFSAYLIGISLLQTTIFKKSGGVLYCIAFSSLFFSLSQVLAVKQTNMLMAVVAVDMVVAVAYDSKIFK